MLLQVPPEPSPPQNPIQGLWNRGAADTAGVLLAKAMVSCLSWVVRLSSALPVPCNAQRLKRGFSLQWAIGAQ